MRIEFIKIVPVFFVLSLYPPCAHASTRIEEETHTRTLALHSLPNGVLLNVFSHLDPQTVGTSRRVCRNWNNLFREYGLIHGWSNKELTNALLNNRLETLEKQILKAPPHTNTRLKMYLDTLTLVQSAKIPYETLVQQNPVLICKAKALRLLEGDTSDALRLLLGDRRKAIAYNRSAETDKIDPSQFLYTQSELYFALAKASEEPMDYNTTLQTLSQSIYNSYDYKPPIEHFTHAIDIYEKYLSDDDRGLFTHLSAAIIYLLSNQAQKGISIVDEFIKNEQLSTLPSKLKTSLFLAYIKSQQFVRAAILSEKVFSQCDPKDQFRIACIWDNTYYEPSLAEKGQYLQMAQSYFKTLLEKDKAPYIKRYAIDNLIKLLELKESKEHGAYQKLLLQITDQLYDSSNTETNHTDRIYCLDAYLTVFFSKAPSEDFNTMYQQRLEVLTDEICKEQVPDPYFLKKWLNLAEKNYDSSVMQNLLAKVAAVSDDPYILAYTARAHRKNGNSKHALQILQNIKFEFEKLDSVNRLILAIEFYNLGCKKEAFEFYAPHILSSLITLRDLSSAAQVYYLLEDHENLDQSIERLQKHQDLFKVVHEDDSDLFGVFLSYLKVSRGDHEGALACLQQSLDFAVTNLETLRKYKTDVSAYIKAFDITRFDNLVELKADQELLDKVVRYYNKKFAALRD